MTRPPDPLAPCSRAMVVSHVRSSPRVPLFRRVYLLGPSHHVHLRTCALSEATVFATPLGDVRVDAEAVAGTGGPGPSGRARPFCFDFADAPVAAVEGETNGAVMPAAYRPQPLKLF